MPVDSRVTLPPPPQAPGQGWNGQTPLAGTTGHRTRFYAHSRLEVKDNTPEHDADTSLGHILGPIYHLGGGVHGESVACDHSFHWLKMTTRAVAATLACDVGSNSPLATLNDN